MARGGPAQKAVGTDHALGGAGGVDLRAAEKVVDVEGEVPVLVDGDGKIPIVRREADGLHLPVVGEALFHGPGGQVVVGDVRVLAVPVGNQEETGAVVLPGGVDLRRHPLVRRDAHRLPGLEVQHPQGVVRLAQELIIEEVPPVRGQSPGGRPVVVVAILQDHGLLPSGRVAGPDVKGFRCAAVAGVDQGAPVGGKAPPEVAGAGQDRQVPGLAIPVQKVDLLVLIAALVHAEDDATALGMTRDGPDALTAEGALAALPGAKIHLPDPRAAVPLAQVGDSVLSNPHRAPGGIRAQQAFQLIHCCLLLFPHAGPG